ncbi:MAG: bifunctional folylpolyglutamate synthase/dihydrofolate synthase [Christensenellaceae bacterium]|nr:bifunctional folylpolyglutamate synthase/dihydrofolate synthase [Christensenellaceae bacterium]
MNYDEALRFINSRAGMGKKLGLQNMRRLLARLGDPQKSFKSLHVAGTNGKGSTCAFLESALRSSGLRTGLYISPYLMRYNERIQLGGQPIGDDALARLTTIAARELRAMEEAGEGSVTIFELGTAIAFLAFKETKIDYAVVEVGLGGRFDPTNVISPVCCAIARIGLDHVRLLGDTIEQIAAEKAGIAKKGVPLVLQAQEESVKGVVLAACAAAGAPFLDLGAHRPCSVALSPFGARFRADLSGLEGEYEIRLPGAHQVENALTALGVLSLIAKEAGLQYTAVRRGLCNAAWPGRLEWFQNALLDGAHNPQGALSAAAYLKEQFPGERFTLLFGMMADKNVEETQKILAPLLSRAVCVRPEGIPRAKDPGELARGFLALGVPAEEAPNTKEGLFRAQSLAEGSKLLICGSLYLAGEARLLLGAASPARFPKN